MSLAAIHKHLVAPAAFFVISMANLEAFHAIKLTSLRLTPSDQAVSKALHILEDWVWNEQERLSSEQESRRSERTHPLSLRRKKYCDVSVELSCNTCVYATTETCLFHLRHRHFYVQSDHKSQMICPQMLDIGSCFSLKTVKE